ncbi:MAG: DUF2007 domain-containing protein [Desulfobacteraceae bacterium]
MKKQNTMDFERVMEVRNAGDQAFIKSLLDSEGIVYFMQGEHVAQYLYHSLPMRLMVRKDHAAAARELLKDFELSSAYDGLKG